MANDDVSPTNTKTDAIGSLRTPDRVVGRPSTPPPDPRLEAARTWSTTARQAAKEAYAAAISSGATRDEAIDAGHKAGFRQNLEERGISPAGGDLVLAVSRIFKAKKVVVLPPGPPRSAREERCFDELFSEHGFRKPRPATSTAQPVRNDSVNEDQEAAGKALASGLAKIPPQQGTLAFGRRTA